MWHCNWSPWYQLWRSNIIIVHVYSIQNKFYDNWWVFVQCLNRQILYIYIQVRQHVRVHLLRRSDSVILDDKNKKKTITYIYIYIECDCNKSLSDGCRANPYVVHIYIWNQLDCDTHESLSGLHILFGFFNWFMCIYWFLKLTIFFNSTLLIFDWFQRTDFFIVFFGSMFFFFFSVVVCIHERKWEKHENFGRKQIHWPFIKKHVDQKSDGKLLVMVHLSLSTFISNMYMYLAFNIFVHSTIFIDYSSIYFE